MTLFFFYALTATDSFSLPQVALDDSGRPAPSYFCQIPLNPCTSKTVPVWIWRLLVGVQERKIQISRIQGLFYLLEEKGRKINIWREG